MTDILTRLQDPLYDGFLNTAAAVEIRRLRAEIERLQRLNATYVTDNAAAQDALKAEIERLRAGLAKHYNALRLRAECAQGGALAAEVPTWCAICMGKGERGKSVDSIQHTPDCPVSLAAEAAD